jgi:hypothetical protein
VFVVGEKKTVVSLLIIGLLLLTFIPGVFASSKNWVEVDRFSGGSWIGGTRFFLIDHVEWRIRWSWKKSFGLSLNEPIFFRFNVLDFRDEHVELVDADHKTNGTVYLFQKRQCFYYLYIIGINLENYTIIIEQNIDSIPEFPSWLILPIFLVTTLSVIAVRKNCLKAHKESNSSENLN